MFEESIDILEVSESRGGGRLAKKSEYLPFHGIDIPRATESALLSGGGVRGSYTDD